MAENPGKGRISQGVDVSPVGHLFTNTTHVADGAQSSGCRRPSLQHSLPQSRKGDDNEGADSLSKPRLWVPSYFDEGRLGGGILPEAKSFLSLSDRQLQSLE
jgi:hypothetical protein